MVGPGMVGDSATFGLQMAAVEAMGRLAHMSFEEGAFERPQNPSIWPGRPVGCQLGAGMKAVLALGWSGVCRALARCRGIPCPIWSTLPADAGWLALDPEVRMRHALSGVGPSMEGKAHVAFDALAGWPELADAEAIAPALGCRVGPVARPAGGVLAPPKRWRLRTTPNWPPDAWSQRMRDPARAGLGSVPNCSQRPGHSARPISLCPRRTACLVPC